ncbi:hypothetical protein, conserved [Eimeria tenella]|uniref:AP5B1 C-terminal domain-containing protein n=1 Tax=Eimeria tenella TaxID=5802 RepID=U6KZY9_EIMTE|nr:hypothetical protein, conserved [Eimeria tenella]CDJ42483.1 hypothetical protein, conserved [Eimeria tenella]|eukprot:XP_013233233.1 hypothetical protein, conserved [Eimeria tenella]
MGSVMNRGYLCLHRFNGSVPFLSLCKSTRERRLLCGLLDEQSAFFLTPKSPPGGLQGGLAGAHEAPTSPLQGELQDLHKQKACFEAVYNQMHGGPAIEALTYGRITPSDKEALPTGVCWGGPRELLQGPSAVAAYYNFLASHSFSVCLPFRLRAIGTPFAGLHKALDGTGASAGAEPGGAPLRSIGGCQGSFSLNALYSIELFFSHSPHYRPLHSVCIPFLQSPIAGPEGGTAVGAQAEAWSPLTKSEEKILQEASEDAFPFNYEIILKLEPLEPVPTVISVGVRFSDERGATYSGSLPPFSVSFQDLFLPVCAPPEFRAVLFDAIWKKTDTAKSVKTLDLKSTVVKQMIEMSLRPFLIEEDFSVETEAFDFCRDQYLHEYPEPLGEAGEASSAAFALGAAPLDGATVVEAPSSPSVPGIVSGQGALQGVDWQAAEVPDMADNADTAAFDVFVDDYFNGQVPYSDIFKDSTDTERSVQGGLDASSTEASGIPVQSPATGPQLDTMRALIFLPPRYHLLFKFTVSPKTTLVRCATDRWEALGYLDAFFSSCYALALSAGHSVGP